MGAVDPVHYDEGHGADSSESCLHHGDIGRYLYKNIDQVHAAVFLADAP